MMKFQIKLGKLTLLMAVLVSFNSNMSYAGDGEIKTRLAFRIPTDPLSIVSMADYDISLLISRNWFEYDESRKAVPGLISSWNFLEKNGGYDFHIDPRAKWSDGSKITTSDLIANLKRAVKLKTSYGAAISGLIKIDQIKVKDASSFFVPTNDGKTAEAFFQRMGSIFLAVINPKDWGSDFQLKENTLSAGPYKIHSKSADEIVLVLNEHFINLNRNPAKTIRIKKPDLKPNLELFLKEAAWENVIQTATLLDTKLADLITQGKFPYWTRGHDRVSLIKPFPGKDIKIRKEFIKVLLSLRPELKKLKYSLNTKVADCLQPIGYPLYKEIKSEKFEISKELKQTNFRVLAPESFSTRYQIEVLKTLFKENGLNVTWTIVPKAEFVPKLANSLDHDLALFDFGVADPEAMTWMGLITEMNFVYLEKNDLAKYKEISKINDKEKETEALRTQLFELGLSGSYAPLFHFSTLSIGQKNISFENIRELDETVDYSKIVLK